MSPDPPAALIPPLTPGPHESCNGQCWSVVVSILPPDKLVVTKLTSIVGQIDKSLTGTLCTLWVNTE